MGILDHVDGCRHGVDVGRHTHHVDDTLLLREQVAADVAAADVCHDGELHVGLIRADDPAQVLFLAELPVAEIVHLEDVGVS